MPYSVIFVCLLVFLVSISLPSLLILRLMKLNSALQERILFLMDRQSYQKDQTIQDLQNKLMSPDTRTYQILASTSQQMNLTNQTALASSDDLISRSDSAEAMRAAQINGGFGEEIFDEVYAESLLDLGVRHD